MSESATLRNHAVFIWSVAGLLRGDYKQSERRVIWGKLTRWFTYSNQPTTRASWRSWNA